MGKKRHKKIQDTVNQANMQVENTQKTAEQVEGQVEEETVPDANAETEDIVDERPSEPEAETPEVQIKEWHENGSTNRNTEKTAQADEAIEKKTKILKYIGATMLVIVVVAGIVIGIAGKDKDAISVNSGAVVTSTVAADSELTGMPEKTTDTEEETKDSPEKADGEQGGEDGTQEITKPVNPTGTPTTESEPTKAPTTSPAADSEPTKAPTATPAADSEPTKAPTITPEPTKTPSVTPTPVVIGNIDTSKYAVYSDKLEGWGVGRNSEHQQPTAWGYEDKYKFDEVGAWYVDKNATEDDKVIYLTFNCGYEVGYTQGYLDVLKKHDVKASWFVLEEYIRQCPEEIRWLMENGHLVGSHSAYHLNYGTESPERIIADMPKNEQRMRDYVGLEMDKIMRPPSGYYNEQTLHIMQDLGYKIYFWSLAYADWDPNDQPTEEYILNYFKTNHHNGAIAVIHITSGKGMKVLDEVITMLKAEGYRFGLVTEIE